MKTKSLIFLFIMFFTFIACNKKDDKTDDPINDSDINSSPDHAPDKIIGKSFVLYNSKMQYTLQASGFTSNNTCTVLMLGSIYKLTATPTYSYSKSTANDANLVVKYSDKLQVGSDYTNTNSTYSAILSFTSATSGSYTGTEKAVSTGNVAGLNGTSTRTISGTFTLD